MGRKRIRIWEEVLFSDSDPSKYGERNQLNAPLKVMVVDDESALLRFMRTMMETDSYVVDTAPSGEIALEKLSTGGAPDVVLLDMVMPGMDGLETLGRIKRMTREQKVVMLS